MITRGYSTDSYLFTFIDNAATIPSDIYINIHKVQIFNHALNANNLEEPSKNRIDFQSINTMTLTIKNSLI